jgi:TonB family protein
MIRSWIYGLLAALPLCTHAECTVDDAHIGRVRQELSPAALTMRNYLFARLCSSPSAQLVDVTDPTLAGRLIAPKGFQFSKQPHDYYPPAAQRLGYQGNVIVGMVVEVDGSTHEVTVLETPGYESLDIAALTIFEEARYKTPAMLDGHPVRVFVYQTFMWRLR